MRERSVTLSREIAARDDPAGERQQSVANALAGVGSVVLPGTALLDREGC